MSTVPFNETPHGSGSLIQISSKEELIRQKLEDERRRLEKEAGLERRAVQQFAKPVERAFTKSQRDHTTILFGGLTWKHEKLIHGALEGLGYKCEALPVPDKKAFQLGKEYGNNGQCNPTYFTVGNLVQFVQDLEAKGLTKDEICDRYVFFTAGACGPCRFGMYEAEYRLALRNAGFDKFRVLLFQQSGGLNQAEAEAGLEMNVDFFLAILNALNIGDIINDVAYQIRPYEINAGETDRVLEESMEILHDVLRRRQPWLLHGKTGDLLKKTNFAGTAEFIGKFVNQLFGDGIMAGLREVRERFAAIPIDRTRVKPIVKITGEFWAQTTEGDGNFNMFRFLEKEGAQVVVEPIATWIAYMMYVAKEGAKARAYAEAPFRDPKWYEVKKRLANDLKIFKKTGSLSAGSRMWNHFYHRTIRHMGDTAHHLIPQKELSRLAHPFYHQLARGGEGFMEVGKNVYYTVNHLCHMVLALKPFGCMPSTQSDGVQSRVVNKFKDMIFLPVETSGEGEVNAHSRVQMALAEAKAKARAEFDGVLSETGKSLEELRAYVGEHPELRHALYKFPHRHGLAGTAAQFAWHVSELMNKDRAYVRRARVSTAKAQVA